MPSSWRRERRRAPRRRRGIEVAEPAAAAPGRPSARSRGRRRSPGRASRRATRARRTPPPARSPTARPPYSPPDEVLLDREDHAARPRRCQQRVDVGRLEHVLERQRRHADHARPMPEPARQDPQLARGQRRRVLVDVLADAGDQRLGGVGQLTADDDHARGDDADDPGQRGAQHPPGLAHVMHGDRVAGVDQLDDLLRRGHLDPRLAELAGDRRARRQHGHAAAVAAGAHDVGGPQRADVPDVAGAPVVAAQQRAAGDDAGADPGGDLDEDHVREVRPVAAVLAERHGVDVALQQRRRTEARGQPVGHRVVVPAGHDRRVDRAPGGDLDRARDADRDAQHVGPRVPRLGQQLVEGALDPVRGSCPARRRSAAAPRARPAPRRRDRRPPAARGARRGRRPAPRPRAR